MRLTGRSEELVDLTEQYCKAQHLFRTDATPDPEFTDMIELDLGTIQPSLAGPKRPQDRVPLNQVKENFERSLTMPKNERGFALSQNDLSRKATVKTNGSGESIGQAGLDKGFDFQSLFDRFLCHQTGPNHDGGVGGVGAGGDGRQHDCAVANGLAAAVGFHRGFA